PGKGEINFAAQGVQSDQAASREVQKVTLDIDAGGDGGGIAGFIIRCFPLHLTGFFSDGDDAGAMSAADVENNQIAFHQWRAGKAEIAFGRGEFGAGIDAPEVFAGVEIPGAKCALRAEREDFSISDGGSGAGAFIE